MNTRELMIGDWVYNAHHKRNIRITPYDFFTHGHYSDGSQFIIGMGRPALGRDLEPIPLSKEILEKNGFTYCKSDGGGSTCTPLYPTGTGT